MRFVWLGLHTEGLPALEALCAAGAPLEAVVTLRRERASARRGRADFRPVCERYDLALHHVTNVNDEPARRLLREMDPDVVFVVGWPQVIREPTLRLARMGMIGAHASLLPHNRGSAPINWALIRGEPETGSTLYWLAPGALGGDVIDQRPIPITPYDTAATLYRQVAVANREMLLRLLPRLLAGERPGRPPPASDEPVLRRRRAADGRIDWTCPAPGVYDFIRALAKPFPGAFSALEGRRWRVWQAALPPAAAQPAAPPGRVLGPMVSPVAQSCGQVVACGQGTIALLELEADDGTRLQGRDLSDQPWTGKQWGDV